MKNLNIYLGISIITTFLLILNLFLNKPVCERIHFVDADRSKNAIANAETSQKIVEFYLYSEEAGILRLYEEFDYDVEVTYDEQNYEWIVHFSARLQDGRYVLDGSRTVWIRRDNGRITNVSR